MAPQMEQHPWARRTAPWVCVNRRSVAGLAQQMGMPADPMMRMDGVEFMQMMAIREGGSAPHAGSPNGCNPMMQIFGLPTGCTGAEYYSRGEIKLYFAKSLQQSFFTPAMAGQTWTNPVTGGLSGPGNPGQSVRRIRTIKKNPGNPAHVNMFDFGATCRNPLDRLDVPVQRSNAGHDEPHQHRGEFEPASGLQRRR